MSEIFWVLAIVWCLLSGPLSFIMCQLGKLRLSWFFTATFWLCIGYLLATFPTLETVIIIVLLMMIVVSITSGE